MRIAITGCCVSRDIFNYDLQGFYENCRFVQLNPISCIGGSAKIMPDFDKLQFRSNFIKKCAVCAMKNDLLDQLRSSKADKLIIDLAEERIPKAKLLDSDGNESVYANHMFFKPMRTMFGQGDYANVKMETIGFDSLPWEKVKKSYQEFAEKITSKQGGFSQEDIIIVEVYLAKEYVGQDYKLHEYNTDNSDFSKEYIEKANAYLKKCYELLKSLLPNSKVIKMPENVYSVYWHHWGINPLHFNTETYKYLLDSVDVIVGRSKSDSLESLYEEIKFRNYISRKMLAE